MPSNVRHSPPSSPVPPQEGWQNEECLPPAARTFSELSKSSTDQPTTSFIPSSIYIFACLIPPFFRAGVCVCARMRHSLHLSLILSIPGRRAIRFATEVALSLVLQVRLLLSTLQPSWCVCVCAFDVRYTFFSARFSRAQVCALQQALLSCSNTGLVTGYSALLQVSFTGHLWCAYLRSHQPSSRHQRAAQRAPACAPRVTPA